MPYIEKQHRLDYEDFVIEITNLVNLHVGLGLTPQDLKCITSSVSVLDRSSATIRAYAEKDFKLRPGHLNYFFTSIFHQVFAGKMRYYDYNEVIGLLEVLKPGYRPVSPISTGHSRADHLLDLLRKIISGVYGSTLMAADVVEVSGMLSCCQAEFYRRSAAPYEDVCITSNGDLPIREAAK